MLLTLSPANIPVSEPAPYTKPTLVFGSVPDGGVLGHLAKYAYPLDPASKVRFASTNTATPLVIAKIDCTGIVLVHTLSELRLNDIP